MCTRSLSLIGTNQVTPLHCFALLLLILTVAFVLPCPCAAQHLNPRGASQKAASNQTIVATSPGKPPAQNQGPDPELLEILKARKLALDQERAQIENDLSGIIRVGLAQQDTDTKRTKRAMCKVNQDLEAITKRIAAHQQKREAFERDWDKYYATLKDTPDVISLKQRKQAIDWDRTQIEEKLSDLVRRYDQQTGQEEQIQWYQVVLREIDERLAGYQKNRDAFEREWEAFYSNR